MKKGSSDGEVQNAKENEDRSSAPSSDAGASDGNGFKPPSSPPASSPPPPASGGGRGGGSPSEPPRDDDRLLSVKELAPKMNVSRQWLYQRVAKGMIPFIRVGGLVRFHWPTIWAWLQGGQLPPSGGMLPSKPRGRR